MTGLLFLLPLRNYEQWQQHNVSINDSTASDSRLLFMEWEKFVRKQEYAELVFSCVLSVIEIPVLILTLIALCFIIKTQPAVSVLLVI